MSKSVMHWEAVHDGEILQLTKEQAVFVEGRFAQVPSLGVSHKLIASFFDGQRLRLFDSVPLCLPVTDKFLCPLPVAEAK
jgi:hypothetical protein